MTTSLRTLWKSLRLLLVLLSDYTGFESVEPGDSSVALAEPVVRVLETGDKVRLAFFGEDKLSAEYPVDTSGKVTMPLIGQLQTAGRSPNRRSRDIVTKLRAAAYLEPKVPIEVLSLSPVYVLDKVQKPGYYSYRSGLTVLRALAPAGGQTYRASETTMLIQHAGEKKMRSYPLRDNLPVFPDDLIKSPERYF